MANNVVDILKGVVGELKEVAKSETIIGDPVTVGDKTVIPVVKISFGFGAGGGQKDNDKAGEFGGGGGGGAKIEPAAFIIMDEKGIKLLGVGKGKWEPILDAIPGIAKKLAEWKEKLQSEKEGQGDKEGKQGETEGTSDDSSPSDTDPTD